MVEWLAYALSLRLKSRARLTPIESLVMTGLGGRS